ncbi:hypothetical protein HYT45_01640 [Candidatus Uhrbacteria bacterium]|nr:hypothetical protein [Candidatus Uhrbacteria bacterium]
MHKRAIVTSEPDADAVAASLLYLEAHGIWISDIDWIFVRSGERAGSEMLGEREPVHIDTGGRFDGIREFDHHQDDPLVRNECAASLVWRSFPKAFQNDDLIRDMVEFVRCADNGKGLDGAYRIEGQFASLMRALSAGLIGLRSVCSNEERMRWGLYTLKAYYAGTRRTKALLAEIGVGGRIKIISTPMGGVLFGETDRGRKELRNFALQNLGEQVGMIVARYGDNAVGVTLLGPEARKVNLRQIADMVRSDYPDCGRSSRLFCHLNGIFLYIYPKDGDKKTVPTPDELLDMVRYAHKRML